MTSPPNLLAKQNRGLLLDIVVFILNLFLMRWLTSYVIELFRFADAGEPLAQFALLLACVSMWVLPVAGAVMKRWHFHRRLKAEGKAVDTESTLAGCVFNPLFYFCFKIIYAHAVHSVFQAR